MAVVLAAALAVRSSTTAGGDDDGDEDTSEDFLDVSVTVPSTQATVPDTEPAPTEPPPHAALPRLPRRRRRLPRQAHPRAPVTTDVGVVAQASLRPDAPALVVDDVVTTFGELGDRARRVGSVLVSHGVGRGDRVAVMVTNSAEWFEAVHGCGRIGAIAVPVNTHFKAEEAGWVVTDSGAKAVIADHGLADSLADVDDIPLLLVGDGYEEALADVRDDDDPPVVADGWPTTMLYTSGTTGRPKGVAIGEDDFRQAAVGFAGMGARWEIGPEDVHLVPGPLYHAAPAAWAHMHLVVGGSAVLMPRWDAEECLRLVERHGVTTTHMVPANFIRILDLPEEVRNCYDTSSLRLVIHAAAACPVPVKRQIMEFLGTEKIWEYYGASEGGGDRHLTRRVARAPGQRRSAVSRATTTASPARTAGCSSRTRKARCGRAASTPASGTTTTTRRRLRPSTGTGSRWATSGTWTTTATSSSPTAAVTLVISGGGEHLSPGDRERPVPQ